MANKRIGGWWCPPLLSGPGSYLTRAQALVERVTPMLPEGRRRVALQAGGHIGTVPWLLGQIFTSVMTFEAEAENFEALECNMLERNTAVTVVHSALGAVDGRLKLRRHPRISGQHQVLMAKGTCPVVKFDTVALRAGLDVLDAIFLDIEGAEILALRGASRMIDRCRPEIIVCEENKRCADFGFRPGDLERELRPMGYALVGRVGEDLIFGSKH